MSDGYRDEFAEESEEHITELNNGLLAFENDPSDEAAMEQIFRTAHTLKGNCGAMGFDAASEVAHAIEDLLESIRANRVKVTPELMDAIFAGVDELEASIDEAAAYGEVQRDPTDAIERLRAYADAPGLTSPTDREVADVLSNVSAPTDSEYSVYHVRLEVASEPAGNGGAVVDALDDAFDLLGTDPARDVIDTGEHDGVFDAVFASVVERSAVEAALDPVDAVAEHVVSDVTDRFGSAADDPVAGDDASAAAASAGASPEEAETASEADAAATDADATEADADASNADASQSNASAESEDDSATGDPSVDELLDDDEVDQFDDLDGLAQEVDDVSEFDDLEDAGSFADLGVSADDVAIGEDDLANEQPGADGPSPETSEDAGPTASAAADSESSASSSAGDDAATDDGGDVGDRAETTDEVVQDATSEFEQLKDEVDPVEFDELQEEIEELEFDEYDSDDEVSFDELLGDEALADEDSFGGPTESVAEAGGDVEDALDSSGDDLADDATGAPAADDTSESDVSASVGEFEPAEADASDPDPFEGDEADEVVDDEAGDAVDEIEESGDGVEDESDEPGGGVDDESDEPGDAIDDADDADDDEPEGSNETDGSDVPTPASIADVALPDESARDASGSDDAVDEEAVDGDDDSDGPLEDATAADLFGKGTAAPHSSASETSETDDAGAESTAVADETPVESAVEAGLDAAADAEADAADETATEAAGDVEVDEADGEDGAADVGDRAAEVDAEAPDAEAEPLDAADESSDDEGSESDEAWTPDFEGSSDFDGDDGTVPAAEPDADDGEDVPVGTAADVTDDSFDAVEAVDDSPSAADPDDAETVEGFGESDSVLDLDSARAPGASPDDGTDGDDAQFDDEQQSGDESTVGDEDEFGDEAAVADEGEFDDREEVVDEGEFGDREEVADDEFGDAAAEDAVSVDESTVADEPPDATATATEDDPLDTGVDVGDVEELLSDDDSSSDDGSLDVGDSEGALGAFGSDSGSTGTDGLPEPGAPLEDPGFSDPDDEYGDAVVSEVDEERLERIRSLGVPDHDGDDGSSGTGGQSIRVDVEQLDEMLNLVEGLVTSRARLRRALGENEPPAVLEDEIDDLEDVTSELQDTVMDVRLVPMRRTVSKLPRIVRDVAREQDIDVDFEIVGEEVELDRSILEEIGDPLVHLVRNAVDHGIERPEERADADKPETGSVELRARRERDRVLVTVEDDGRGIDPDDLRDAAVEEGIHTREEVDAMDDEDALELVFHPGLSTAEEVTDVSGRGVGMDVVAETVEELDGSVRIDSEVGDGTTVELELPVTLAIAEMLFVEVGGEEYGIPVDVVDEIGPVVGVETQDGCEVLVSDGGEDERELVRLDDALETDSQTDPGLGMLVHLRDDVREATLLCDDVRGQQEIVVKPFEGVLSDVPGLAGATVLGDGDVVNILDVETL